MINKDLPELDRAVKRLVYEHNLREESLTQRQLVEAIKQAIASGDFIRQVSVPPGNTFGAKQCVAYIPYRQAVEHQRTIIELEERIAQLEAEVIRLQGKLSSIKLAANT